MVRIRASQRQGLTALPLGAGFKGWGVDSISSLGLTLGNALAGCDLLPAPLAYVNELGNGRNGWPVFSGALLITP